MSAPMHVAFFGSSLVSAYWNGAATYYRGLLRALAARGHRITFYEPDAFDRQAHRDLDDPSWAKVVVYSGTDPDDAYRVVEAARHSDVVVKASGVGVWDELLESAVLSLKSARTRVGFCDVDAPATLERMESNPADPFRPLVSQYDFVFTYGGGPPVRDAYLALGARSCVPIYNALDPDTHHPVPADPRFFGDLGLLANRLPDREARIHEFFFRAAAALPNRRLLLAGSGWAPGDAPRNVEVLGHLPTRDHNAFNVTPLAVLNVNRDSMARFGYSPATRVFEAAGAGACLITDAFVGVELFLEPDREILVARNGEEVAERVASLDRAKAQALGEAARRRMLAHHTYHHRAGKLERLLGGGFGTTSDEATP